MYYNNDCLKRAVCSSCNKRVSRFYNMSLRLRNSVYGGVPEWPKGTDCKSAASSFGGSNPPSSTRKKDFAFCKVLFSVKFALRRVKLLRSEIIIFDYCEIAFGSLRANFISHFASAAGPCQHGGNFVPYPCNFVKIRL